MRPKAPVRRYDVFAAWKYLEARRAGESDRHAKRYGVWVATVVAGRKAGGAVGSPAQAQRPDRTDFLGLTADDYDHRVRARMGATFHDRVFLPALRRARRNGLDYMEIRDEIRAKWE